MSAGPAGGERGGAGGGAGRDGGPAYLVFVTGPDREALLELGRRVVGERLAACVNVLGDLASVYRWEDEVQEDAEGLALMKTTGARLEVLRERVLELHPYDEPEFVAVEIDRGSSSYLSWVAASVGGA